MQSNDKTEFLGKPIIYTTIKTIESSSKQV